jgi:uncharacterized protein (TIGR02145 family)
MKFFKYIFSIALLITFFLSSCKKEDEEPETTTGPTGTAQTSSPGSGVTDADGNFYNTIVLSNGQEWMKEDLQTTKYANGDPIDNLVADVQWEQTTTGAWSYYENDPIYQSPYGKLYNFYAVVDSRNVCPTGWHAATKTDWEQLVNLVDENSVMNTTTDITLSPTAGGALKMTDTTYWEAPNVGATNEIDFSAVSSGDRDNWGMFDAIKGWGNWWTGTPASGGEGWFIEITNYDTDIYIDTFDGDFGFSVRCVKD